MYSMPTQAEATEGLLEPLPLESGRLTKPGGPHQGPDWPGESRYSGDCTSPGYINIWVNFVHRAQGQGSSFLARGFVDLLDMSISYLDAWMTKSMN